jgi:hypothetical protein
VACAERIVLCVPLSEPSRLAPFVEDCVRDGVKLIALVGDGCATIEDDIDAIIVGDGTDESRFIVTTSHPDETIEEAMAFAQAWPADSSDLVQAVSL